MIRIFKKLYIPLAWTIFIETLFCLPGTSLPEQEAFQFDGFDKICHFLFFTVFVSLWCLYFYSRKREFRALKIIFFVILVIALANGIIVEYIQFYYIPFRSFDLGDIIADMMGATLTYGVCNILLLKEPK